MWNQNFPWCNEHNAGFHIKKCVPNEAVEIMLTDQNLLKIVSG